MRDVKLTDSAWYMLGLMEHGDALIADQWGVVIGGERVSNDARKALEAGGFINAFDSGPTHKHYDITAKGRAALAARREAKGKEVQG
jgi:hypothetical protein